MLSDYEAEIAALMTKTYSEIALEEQNIIQIKMGNGDAVNVRSEPGSKGDVVLKLKDGDSLLAVGITNETDEIDGENAFWIHVREIKANEDKGGFSETGTEGWVFAAYTNYGETNISADDI